MKSNSKNRILNAEAIFKSLGPADGEPEGTFEALVSVFGNVDRHGDRVNEKAFDNTLAHWREKADATGARLPIIFNHNWADPMAFVGSADPNDVKATPRGLLVKGRMDNIDPNGAHYNPVAAQVHSLMKSRALTEWSFGYMVPKGGESKASDGAYDINDLELFEAGPTLKGVNPDTELLAVKAYADVDVPGSFEEIQEALCNALAAEYPNDSDMSKGQWTSIVATTPSEVTYQVCRYGYGDDTDGDQMYQASYTIAADGVATLADAKEVEVVIQPKALRFYDGIGMKADEPSRADLIKQAMAVAHTKYPDGVPESVTKQIFKDPQAYIDANKGDGKALVGEKGPEVIVPIETKAWDGSASKYTDAEWQSACILDRGDSFDTAKTRYALPIATPGNSASSDPDADGCAAAATRINQVDAPEAAKAAAARKLAAAYRKLGNDVPEGVSELAAKGVSVSELQLQEYMYSVSRAMSADEMETLAKGREIEAELLALEAEMERG